MDCSIKFRICVLSATLHELEPLVSDTDDRKTHEKYEHLIYLSLVSPSQIKSLSSWAFVIAIVRD